MSFLETYFRLRGQVPAVPGPACPSDESLAGWIDGVLPAGERRRVGDHLLACAACHQVLGNVLSARPSLRPSVVRIAVRLLARGLALLEPLGEAARSLGAPRLALGAVRGPVSASPSEMLTIAGPGQGLDRVELQLQPNGQVRLSVAGSSPPVQPGEVSSIVLEVDGSPREKRPYTGSPLAFAPLDRGSYRLRLVARAPGRDARSLSETALELR